ncbi:WD40 repeat-like protein [Gyrodon lividus]|nr:WD40 repeat-like protein [Gyrodon lividus]
MELKSDFTTIHPGYASSVHFSPDSKRVVLGYGSKFATICVWIVDTGELAFKTIQGADLSVGLVRYSPNGDKIASLGHSTIRIWDAYTGAATTVINQGANAFVWTSDDHLMSAHGGKITVWHPPSGQSVQTLEAHHNRTHYLTLSPSGNHFATASNLDETAVVIDISTGERIKAFEYDGEICDIVYSPSGRFIATNCAEDRVCLWVAPAVEDPQAVLPEVSFLDLPAVSQLGEVVQRGDAISFLDLPATARPKGTINRMQVPSSTHVNFRNRLRNAFTLRFNRRTPDLGSEEHTSRWKRKRLLHVENNAPTDDLERLEERHTAITEARTRPVFAWEVGPFPDEIERGCFFHCASYICYGQRDPNKRNNHMHPSQSGSSLHNASASTNVVLAPLPHVVNRASHSAVGTSRDSVGNTSAIAQTATLPSSTPTPSPLLSTAVRPTTEASPPSPPLANASSSIHVEKQPGVQLTENRRVNPDITYHSWKDSLFWMEVQNPWE